MLWYTWVRRLLGSLPAIAANRSPNSAMAAARILSRSCKTEGSEPQPNLLGGPHLHLIWEPAPLCGDGAQFLSRTLPPRLRAPRGASCLPPQTSLPGWVPGHPQGPKIITPSHSKSRPTTQVSHVQLGVGLIP